MICCCGKVEFTLLHRSTFGIWLFAWVANKSEAIAFAATSMPPA